MTPKPKGSPPADRLPQTWLLRGEDPRFFDAPAGRWAGFWGGEEGCVSFPAPALSPPAFHAEVNSLPFLRERQVIRLTHLEGASPDLLEAVAGYCAKPSPTTALLLEYSGKAPASKKNLTRAETAIGAIFDAVPALACQPQSASAYTAQRLAEAGFKASSEVVAALDDWASGDVGRVAAALDLLLLYRVEEKTLRPQDVEALLGAGGSPAMWNLSHAFAARESGRFRALLSRIELDPEVQKNPANSAIAIVGMLAKQVRALLVARGNGGSAEGREATTRVLSADPFKMSSSAIGRIFNALPGWGEDELREAFGVLFHLDLALKGGPGEGPPWTLLELRAAPLVGAQGGGKMGAARR